MVVGPLGFFLQISSDFGKRWRFSSGVLGGLLNL